MVFDILQAVTINNKFHHVSLDIWDTDMAIVCCYIHRAIMQFIRILSSAAVGNHNFKLFYFFHRYGNPRY